MTHSLMLIDNSGDWVRREIELTLELDKPLIPVLVGGASMPNTKMLPDSIKTLAYRNAVEIRPDPDFHYDVDRLTRVLKSIVSNVPPERTKPYRYSAPDFNPDEINTNRVFVSHSTSDRVWVEREIVQLLQKNSIETWYAESSIMTARQWEREILEGMRKCDWFLLVISPRAASSEWVKDELFWAIDNRTTRIVP